MNKTTIYYNLEDLSMNTNYQNIKSASMGNCNSNEITESGNIELCIIAPYITSHEINRFNEKTPIAYYFERENKSAIIFDFGSFKCELVINPSYYHDNRYELFKQGDEREMLISLIDSSLDKIVARKLVSLKGKVLDMFRKGLELNNKCTRDEYNAWISNTLYKNDYKYNIKTSYYLGKCYEVPNVEFII